MMTRRQSVSGGILENATGRQGAMAGQAGHNNNAANNKFYGSNNNRKVVKDSEPGSIDQNMNAIGDNGQCTLQ